MARIPVYQVAVPEYHVRSPPDHKAIGRKIDAVLKRHFMGQKVVIRCLGSQEHPGKSVDGLVHIIKFLGTDRYDPDREGDRYENVSGKHIDFFAIDFRISEKGRYLENFIEPFYHWPKKLRGYPVRIDIVIVYDRAKVKRVLHRYEDRIDTKRDGFAFKDHSDKPGAIKGIVRIL